MNTPSIDSTVKRKRFWPPTLLFAITGLLAVIAVPLYGFIYGYHWYQWLAFAVMGAMCSLSITAGYHRLWSHKTYEAHWSLRLLFALFGAAALQDSILKWCDHHRHHHQFVDNNDRDPYSAKRGFWFSHIEWMMYEYPTSYQNFKNVQDLQRDKIVIWQHNNYIPITVTMNLGILTLLGIITGDIIGMFLLAGALRIAFCHHTTFMVNSIIHKFGSQPYRDDVTACDNKIVNFFVFGEGYHNYHHAFQLDYRNGIHWFHYDPTKWVIKALSLVGITRNLKVASPVKIQKAKLDLQFKKARKKLQSKSAHRGVKEALQSESLQFTHTLEEWEQLQSKKTKRGEKLSKWELTQIQTKTNELAYSLKMQGERLQALMKHGQEGKTMEAL
ncbi:fatty acid desaturase [Microbulbifer sp. OS29]|uniref:Fatty acid desaturase n=1 Tax=Microbulbifer okhotskensis TaxID=2926617 RepID=A0A9X2EQI3_9GAMM|nr:fatty acid desaturase [Microbulbifer okhotskensis]MCO1333813.1 fatty acid desaturase [Microbulbifer okhotskensis]